MVPEYPAALQSAGRYVAFGLIALPLAWADRKRLRGLSRADWTEALKLSAVGNLLYYFFLASAIQRTGAPVSTMIIGTLPVVIAVTANLLYGRQEGVLSWWRLAPPLLLILLGLLCVNLAELNAQDEHVDMERYLSGIGMAIIAVICWTWYPLRNARWLRRNLDKKSTTWATAQGIVTLPMALLAYVIVSGQLALTKPDFALPFGPRPLVFIGLMLAIGLLCSWLLLLESGQSTPAYGTGGSADRVRNVGWADLHLYAASGLAAAADTVWNLLFAGGSGGSHAYQAQTRGGEGGYGGTGKINVKVAQGAPLRHWLKMIRPRWLAV